MASQRQLGAPGAPQALTAASPEAGGESAESEMLGLVSHELRNPATAMIMTAETLAAGRLGELTPAQKAAAERIMAAGHYLVDLIDEYLDVARLEGGQWPVRPRTVTDFVADVVCPAIETTAPAVAAAGMRLIQHVPAEMGSVQCDPGLMRIVLANLLGNAAKYGREGGQIRLSLYRLTRRVEISVYNDGTGFAAEKRGLLFRKFARLDDPRPLARKGAGMGLYTCWRIVDGHGGAVTAASEHGHWAEFTVSIPQPLPTRNEAC